jgi:glucosamine--fructose-6-phosphate aminotransferase (isomerizing)
MSLQAGSYTHQEIMGQPQAWETTLQAAEQQIAPEDWLDKTSKLAYTLFVGCGSTYYLSLSIASLWRKLVGQPAWGLPASEVWLYPDYTLTTQAGDGLFIAVSRSGETTETLRALDIYQQRGSGSTLAVTCYADSSLARQAEHVWLARGAEEKSIAQTRSFTSMYLLLQVGAMLAAGRKDLLAQLRALPEQFVQLVGKYEVLVKGLAENPRFERFIFLGSGANYGLACEAMLKMKEMSLAPSEAFHFMEFRHGPKSVVAPGTLVVALPGEAACQWEAQVLSEVRALGASVLAIAENGKGVVADYMVELHSGLDELASRMLAMPFLQLVAYYRSLYRGLDPDHPNHLDAVVRLE